MTCAVPGTEKGSLPNEGRLKLTLPQTLKSNTCVNKSAESSYFSVRPPKNHHPDCAEVKAFSAYGEFSITSTDMVRNRNLF